MLARQDERDFEIMKNFVRERAAFFYNGPRLTRMAMLRVQADTEDAA